MSRETFYQNLPVPGVLLGGLGAGTSTLFVLGKVIQGPLKKPAKALDSLTNKPMRPARHTPLQGIMKLASGPGEPWTLYPAVGLFGAWSLGRGEKADAATLAAALAGSAVINEVAKKTVQRPRPTLTERMLQSSGSSFPSQHITMSLAAYGAMAYIFSRHTNDAGVRVRVWAAVLALCLLVGMSRVYLGVHHPSDVLAGFLAGGIWLFTCAVAHDKLALVRE